MTHYDGESKIFLGTCPSVSFWTAQHKCDITHVWGKIGEYRTLVSNFVSVRRNNNSQTVSKHSWVFFLHTDFLWNAVLFGDIQIHWTQREETRTLSDTTLFERFQQLNVSNVTFQRNRLSICNCAIFARLFNLNVALCPVPLKY